MAFITWQPTGWKFRPRILTADERSLLDGACRRINRLLGKCECGGTPEAIGRRDRCAKCLEKR